MLNITRLRLVNGEITARCPRDYGSLKCGNSNAFLPIMTILDTFGNMILACKQTYIAFGSLPCYAKRFCNNFGILSCEGSAEGIKERHFC